MANPNEMIEETLESILAEIKAQAGDSSSHLVALNSISLAVWVLVWIEIGKFAYNFFL